MVLQGDYGHIKQCFLGSSSDTVEQENAIDPSSVSQTNHTKNHIIFFLKISRKLSVFRYAKIYFVQSRVLKRITRHSKRQRSRPNSGQQTNKTRQN